MPLTYTLSQSFHRARHGAVLGRSGATAVEMILVATIIGLLTAMGFPQMRQALDKAGVRAARADVTTFTALARASAVQRGCRSVMHLASGANSRVWVTACPRHVPGPGSVDTVAPIDDVQSRYHVSLTATDDSVQFDPRGMRVDYRTTVVRFTGAGAASADSLTINPLGKAVRP